MKLLFATFFAGCLVFSSLAQSENKTLGAPTKNSSKVVYYSVVSDNPENLQVFSLMLPVWNLAGSKINSSIYDFNTGLFYSGSKFQAFVRYKMGLVERVAPETREGGYPNGPLMFSVNKVPNSQELNVSGTYFFKGTDEKVTETMKLKTSGNVTTVTNIPVTAHKSVGFNAGYAQGFTWYNMNNTNVNAVLLDDGTEQTVKVNSMSSIQTYKFIKLGLTFRKAVDIVADFEGYGKRKEAYVNTTWINLIGAVQNQFDDVFVPASGGVDSDLATSQTVYVTRASIDAHNKKLPFGFEFGQRFTSKRSFFSIEYGVKYLPGMMKNFNLMVEAGLNININFLRGK